MTDKCRAIGCEPDMLEELLNDDTDAMTAWEVEFVESVNTQRSRASADWQPSAKQCATIDEIWHKVFG